MRLVVDFGNTRTKAAFFEGQRLIGHLAFPTADSQGQLQRLIRENPGVTQIVSASVAAPHLEDFLRNCGIPWYRFSSESKFPMRNLYATPATVGMDRLLLASGSVLSYPGKDRLVISVGTCITYDFTNAADEYLGGAISPGLRMRYAALNRFTARLPLLEPEFPEDFIGDSTAASLHAGVVVGALNEIDGFIRQYRDRYSNFIIILTGGDGEFLAKRLKNTIFAHPIFLLESLNQTYQFSLDD